MAFSILHISDLHRDLKDEVDNVTLVDSLVVDVKQTREANSSLLSPALCIVSGDLVFGSDSLTELDRQYNQAEEFLIQLCDSMFQGDREKIIILPGNHDVSLAAVKSSLGPPLTPNDAEERRVLVGEFFEQNSQLRWSWSDLAFLRINNSNVYKNRLSRFSQMYASFYLGRRQYSIEPECQFDTFDYPDLGFSIVTLNSCHHNDPLRRRGEINAQALTQACKQLRDPARAGWLTAAAWHHNIFPSPGQDDYLNAEAIQKLIDAGASLGFHGHQHAGDCVDERYKMGTQDRNMTIISAGTLCADPLHLKPGVPRGYNIVALDTNIQVGTVHQRRMVNSTFNLPIWGPGQFISNGRPEVEFSISAPLKSNRPNNMNSQLFLEDIEMLIGKKDWHGALTLLSGMNIPEARPFLIKALEEIGDLNLLIETLSPPLTNGEAVLIGAAIIESRDVSTAKKFLELEFIKNNVDQSVAEIKQRVERI